MEPYTHFVRDLSPDIKKFILTDHFKKTDEISEKRKNIIIKKLLENEKFTEIGESLNVSATAVRIQFVKGIKKIKELILRSNFNSSYENLLKTPIAVSGMKARCKNILTGMGFLYLSDVLTISSKDFLKQRNSGSMSWLHLREYMEGIGIPLKEKNFHSDEKNSSLKEDDVFLALQNLVSEIGTESLKSLLFCLIRISFENIKNKDKRSEEIIKLIHAAIDIPDNEE